MLARLVDLGRLEWGGLGASLSVEVGWSDKIGLDLSQGETWPEGERDW